MTSHDLYLSVFLASSDGEVNRELSTPRFEATDDNQK